MPNLLELIARDEELQRLREELSNFFAEGARSLTTDVAGAPMDIVNALRALSGAGAFMKNEDGIAAGSSAAVRKMAGQPTEPQGASGLAGNILGSMVSPGKAAAGSAAALAPALAGIIRKGGLDKLFMTHNVGGDMPTSPEGLRELADMFIEGKSFSSPSIAINQATTFPFDTTPTLLMNPAQELFDPAINPGALLFNRDAYVSRSRTLETPGPLDDLRMTEGAMPSLDKGMAIMSSPRFKSFKSYEEDPRGAALLRQTSGNKSPAAISYQDISDMQDAIFRNAAGRGEKNLANLMLDTQGKAHSYEMTPEMFRAYHAKLQELATENPELAAYMEALPRVSSDYAELKLVGNMPLSSDYISALILPDKKGPGIKEAAARRYLQEAAQAVGIPAGTAWDLAPQSLRNTLENGIERAVDSSIKNDEWLNFDKSALKDYRLYGMSPIMGKDLMMESALDEIAKSERLQQEVARWLTRKAVE